MKNQIKCYCGHTKYCDCSPLPKQETLEEAGLKHCELIDKFPALENPLFSFKEGVKWKTERVYSDMEEYADYCLMCSAEKTLKIPISPKEWFEQFKKK